MGNSIQLNGSSTHESEPVGNIEVEPLGQKHLSLGFFSSRKPPKGFSIGITPESETDSDVNTEMLSIGSVQRYELVLQIANFSNQPIVATIWRLN